MTEVRTQLRISDPQNVNEVNLVLAQIANRLDQMEGYRGTPAFKADIDLGGNRGTNAANAVATTDIPPLNQVSGVVTSEVTTQVTAQMSNVLQYNKPIGTIHISTNSANPHTYLGYGTWVAFGAGKVLIGIDPGDTDFDTVLEEGGSKVTSINHTHTSGTSVDNNADGSTVQVKDGAYSGDVSTVQPYIVVYIWHRTA